MHGYDDSTANTRNVHKKIIFYSKKFPRGFYIVFLYDIMLSTIVLGTPNGRVVPSSLDDTRRYKIFTTHISLYKIVCSICEKKFCQKPTESLENNSP